LNVSGVLSDRQASSQLLDSVNESKVRTFNDSDDEV
jgi:hypothetical protein